MKHDGAFNQMIGSLNRFARSIEYKYIIFVTDVTSSSSNVLKVLEPLHSRCHIRYWKRERRKVWSLLFSGKEESFILLIVHRP